MMDTFSNNVIIYAKAITQEKKKFDNKFIFYLDELNYTKKEKSFCK